MKRAADRERMEALAELAMLFGTAAWRTRCRWWLESGWDVCPCTLPLSPAASEPTTYFLLQHIC
jgi:hypothetical protein